MTLRDKSGSPKPPDFPASVCGNFTGIWMGWWWKDGKPTKPAPPVER